MQGSHSPPAVLQVYWAHFPVLSFPFLCPTFRHYIGYLGISLITPPYPCSLTSLDYHHYLKQQWPLLILSRSLQRAPGNLGALILQQFGADTSKTHDFNKEECWTSRSVSKKLQEEHEIRRQASVYRTDKVINTRVLSSKSSNKTYFSLFHSEVIPGVLWDFLPQQTSCWSLKFPFGYLSV